MAIPTTLHGNWLAHEASFATGNSFRSILTHRLIPMNKHASENIVMHGVHETNKLLILDRNERNSVE